MNTRDPEHESQLLAIVSSTPWLMLALHHVRSLGLPDWCIGAGAIRSTVWNHLQGTDTTLPTCDIDVAYFDTSDTSRARDESLTRQLIASSGITDWDVVNQAGVHEWYPEHFGQSCAPFASLDEAVGSWPEYATCVGVRLLDDGTLRAIAPHGLGDLFTFTVRHNPSLIGVETYRQRIAQKQFRQRWPRVRVVAS